MDFSEFHNDSKYLDTYLVLEVTQEDFSEKANKISAFDPYRVLGHVPWEF